MKPTIGPRPRAMGDDPSDRLGLALAAFAVALAVLLLVPPFLKGDVGLEPGFTWQEALDLLTPIVVLPIAAVILELAGRPALRLRLAFVVVAAAWVLGQAMHLGTNAVGDAFTTCAAEEAFYATGPGELSHWFDEVLSHWIWHLAWVGIIVLFLLGANAARRTPGAMRTRDGRLVVVAGVVHGLTWFFVTVEGVTAALGIPSAGILLIVGLADRRSDPIGRVMARFLIASSAVALLGYGTWATLNGGSLPEFMGRCP